MPNYIGVPVVSDPVVLEQFVYDTIQAAFPGWQPSDGNVEVVLAQAMARIAAENATLATTALQGIYRSLSPLFGILPLNGAPASVGSTWTMRDDSGYTISAGTIVGISAAGDLLIPFTVLADVTIPPGNTLTAAGEVTLRAITAGSDGSGLGGAAVPATLIDPLDFVVSVVLTSVTTGGIDAELDPTFLNRFRTELQLLSPRPIIPADFAAIALNTPGVSRAVAIDGYDPPVNELETITVNATGGTFTLTYSGQTTGTIAWNASAATVQTALEALSNIAPGDVLCTGGLLATAPVTVEFKGALAGTNVTQMTANSGSLTGGTHTATIATLTGGSASSSNNERTVAVALVDEAGQPVASQTKADIAAALEELREVNFIVNVIDPIYTSIDVAYTATAQAGQDTVFVKANIDAAIAFYLNPATWGAISGDQFSWVDRTKVRFLELAKVIGDAFGVDHLDTLTLCVHAGTPGTADVTLPGPAALPLAGTITGTVS